MSEELEISVRPCAASFKTTILKKSWFYKSIFYTFLMFFRSMTETKIVLFSTSEIDVWSYFSLSVFIYLYCYIVYVTALTVDG